MEMRKYISVNASENETGGIDINVDVLDSMSELQYVMCGGYIESSDLEDLTTPATLMVMRLTGSDDELLIEQLADAFAVILTPEPVNTVSINGERFA
jgi:hypothetical protein